MAKRQLVLAHAIPATAQTLAPALQRAVQVLCDTYEAIDLRIETTLGAAEADFVSALPEVEGHDAELCRLVKWLIADMREAAAADAAADQPVLLRFAYQDKDDLVEQLLSGAKARLVVVPVDGDVTLHADIEGISL